MEKNIFIAIFALIFSACTFNEYEKTDSDYYSEYITISERQWETVYYEGNLLYYYCEFDFPLTPDIINYKPIDVYYETPDEGYLTPLPYSTFIIDRSYKYEEHLTVEYEPGRITFILKYDDQLDVPPRYDYYRFLVKFPI
ncbi:MAG: hypothetical protein LBI65_04430 [Candidatus Symbiothrix sp.]|jgi:hypothetical protein|nr:hypothetical protein [Candidatus Symbiothrix sp.]